MGNKRKNYQNTVLTNVFELHIINLRKAEKIIDNYIELEEDRKLAVWSKFLINPDGLEVFELKKNPNVKLAKDELGGMSRDAYERRLAELREKAIMDEKSFKSYGYDLGMEDGIKKRY